MDSVDVINMTPNESTQTVEDLELCKSKPKNWPKTPFPINHDINARVILYDGDIEPFRADAIVNPTNENLSQLGNLAKLAGPELEAYVKKRPRLCATGDVRLTPGFNSNFKHIIHAVPPKYQPKYKTAAETALFHTYFRILETMIEKKIRTVVMPTLATTKCNLPVEDNCHMQFRVIRRMLEKKLKDFDKIVVHVRDIDICRPIFFQYFPRSSIDEEITCYKLGPLIGGPNGEPVIPEREIRIKGKPAVLDPNGGSIDLTSGLDLSTVVGRTAFSKMREDLDKRHMSNISSPNNQLANRKPAAFRGCNLL